VGFRKARKKKEKWLHPQFVVQITKKYPDKAFQTMRFVMKDVPGIVEVSPKIQLAYEHSFYFVIPREYPQNLGSIRITSETPLFHPRMGVVGTNACYAVNGEIDRILIDLIYNVLLRPETVRPPSLFKEADWGLNSKKMHWYIHYGPHKIYEFLQKEWGKKQKKIEAKPKSKITILS
jgi:hypothetical protein